MVPEDLENNIPQSVWNLAAPSIAQDDDTTRSHGYNTIQKLTEEQIHDTDIALEANTEHHHDQLAQLYGKASRQQDISLHEYCTYIRNLNTEQCHIVMFNRAWCKSYVNARRKNETIKGYRVFLSGPGGTGKSHVLKLIQRDMYYFLHSTVNAEPDQPIVLTTAPTGSAAFQIGGSTIDSALLIYESGKNKPSWEKKQLCNLNLNI